jgi:uncharacterized protein
MSQENVELARRAYEAFNRGDLDGMVADFAPTFQYVPTGAIPGAGDPYRGRWKEFVRWFMGEFDDARVEIRELTEAGDQVLASLTLRGRGKQSGVEASWDVWHVWTVRDGKLIHGQGFARGDEALEAAGLREQATSQENVEILHQAFDAFNRRDLDAFLALCDPELEFVSYWMQVEGGGPYRGHDGVREWWEGLFAVYPDFTGELEEVRDLGDRTIARMHVHGRGVESDVPIDLSDEAMWHVAGYRHGKVIWWHFFGSEADALEAAGVQE